MRVLVVMCLGLGLMGCVGSGIKAENGMIIRTAGETNMFRPSLSVMEVLTCVKAEGQLTQITVDGVTEVCNGEFKQLALVQGTQAGAMTGIGSAAVQGGAIVGAGYLVGKGIADSGSTTNVNQEGGGAESNSGALSLSGASASSNSASKSINSNKNFNHNTNKNINQTRGYGHR